ncbi:MAG TPA: DNA mismatch repair endonuclease MutL [Candidatus Binataceae bacterium]|nr:DNA mismatch repair endonuclease MutL [Candidatus Binataceae bacterium]
MAARLIHILPEQVASQIAAGEVVERPASAVKELAENSLDAGARMITVEIERGGRALISVADDGCGMSREDAIVALRRHATSKIRTAADLTAIRTLGFRGEALASIASVAHLRLVTRTAADEHGVEISASGGEIAEARECAIAAGTRVEVRDLFFNTPARLKFLKTEATEQGAVADAIQRLALANCTVAFRLAADGRVLFDLPRASSLLERLRQIAGPRLAAQMLAFELKQPGLRVSGLTSMSQESFASPRLIFTFVNGRAVRDKLLQRAIAQAYQTLLPRGRHPAAVVCVDLRHEDVDVNVHPMKTEVRFRSSGAVFEAVYRALRARLSDQTAAASPVFVAPSQAPAVAIASSPQPSAAPSDGAAAADRDAAASAAVAVDGFGSRPIAPVEEPSIVTPERPLKLVADAARASALQRPLGLGFDRERQGLSGAPAAGEAAVPMYSRLRIVGQLFAGYIALESDEGLILVDQHAAHERVTFERLRSELRGGGIKVQAMLTARTVELNPARAAQVLAALPEIRAMGFDVEPFGQTALLLKGTPAAFGASGGAELLADMIDSMSAGGWNRSGEAAFEDLLKQLSCHGSVRVGRVLAPAEIQALLEELDRTEFKTNCPHGRPVHIRFPRGQIERMFRR